MEPRQAARRGTAIRARRPVALAALRGFDAAARHLSFTLAAGELSLSQSAISRQVSALERQVGKALFVRRTRALELTADGRELHRTVARALAAIDGCVDTLRGAARQPGVSLSTFASFSSLWLVPRLAGFQQAHPGIEIRVDASDRFADLAADGLDLAIRRTLPSRIDASAPLRVLGEEYVTPALSPQLLERRRLRTPADLQRLPLIDLDDGLSTMRDSSWPRWFEAFGVAPRAGAAGRMTFSVFDQAVQAAIRGQGVVLGRTPMIDDALAAGQLCAPFPALKLATGYRYHLLLRAERAAAAEVSAFVRWLVGEFARGPQQAG